MAGDNHSTTDHDEIRAWAEERGGKPATVLTTSEGDEPGLLRIKFPGYGDDSMLDEISWEDWFAKFDDAGLKLIYQGKTEDGEPSTFNKLVRRD